MAPYRLIRLRKNTSKGAEILGASTMSYTAACCRLCLPVLGGCTYHIHIRKVVIPKAVEQNIVTVGLVLCSHSIAEYEARCCSNRESMHKHNDL
jgi:hypothetical protein